MSRRTLSLALAAVGAGLITYGTLVYLQQARRAPNRAQSLATQTPPPPHPEGPLPQWKGPGLAKQGNPAGIDLGVVKPVLQLAATCRPAKPNPDTSFVFHDPEPFGGVQGWYQLPLPFRVPGRTHRFAPPGMKVFVDGVEATFLISGLRRHIGRDVTWRLSADGELIVTNKGATDSIRIEHPALLEAIEELEPGPARTSGQAAVDFAHQRVHLGDLSHSGWLLPAPASAVWQDITLPQDARFLAHPTLRPAPISSSSDGVRMTLFVRDASGEHEISHINIPANTNRYLRWDADLSAWSNQRVDLIVRVDPQTNHDFDYAFLGSPKIHGSEASGVRRIIVIGIDTLRADKLGVYGSPRPTSPELDAWAKTAIVFDNAWTAAPRTRPSFRAATTGRHPQNAICDDNLATAFQRNGFATAGIVSNIHLNPRFGFDQGFDMWWLDTRSHADEQVDRALTWLDDHQSFDTYLFLHFMDPHIFYDAPEPWASRFSSQLRPLPSDQALPPRFNRWMVYRWLQQHELSPLRRAHIIAAYEAEVAYTSSALGRFLNAVDEMPGRTTVIIHNDHGEELFDHGGFEHNHTLYDEVVRGVFMIKPPGGTQIAGARSPAIATLEDIAPTLYDLAGITEHPPTDGISLMPALRGDPMDPDRAVGIAHLKYNADQWAVVWKQHKYIVTTGSGEDMLFDLKADPGEYHDLSDTIDITPWLKKLGEAHGIPAGIGWRINFRIGPQTAVDIQLPSPALDAGIYDPERVTAHPVNQVWGETPPRTTADIGTVSLSSDGRTLHLQGGQEPFGVLWIRFDEAPTPEGTQVTLRGDLLTVSNGRFGSNIEGGTITRGPVIVPPPDEAARILHCRGQSDQSQQAVSTQERAALEALGYIHDNDDGTTHSDPP